MKCPHCNQVHSDNALFCENTGKKIERPLKACTNQACQEFGKNTLPIEALFCPKCGKKIGDSTYMYVSNNNLDCLRVVWGVKLGETLVQEIGLEKQGDTLFRTFWSDCWRYEPAEGVSFLSDKNDVFVSASFHAIPKEWEMLGIDLNTNSDDLKLILSKWKFKYLPLDDYELYEVLKQNNEEWCEFVAPDGNYGLCFQYEKGTIVLINMFIRDSDIKNSEIDRSKH